METVTSIKMEFPARHDSSGNIMRFRKAWDNGGETVDCYTVTFELYNDETGKWDIYSEGVNCNSRKGDLAYKKIYCLGMSSNPFHPQGFGQSCTCVEGRHLGKRIKFSDLPEEVQKCVLQYMQG
jgi:hypothetical protein